MNSANEQRRTLRVEEAAAILGIGRNAAYSAVKRGELPTIKVGRRILVPAAALDRLLAEAGAGMAERTQPQPVE